MICFFKCVEITRPLAAVAKYAIGLNNAPFAELRVVRRSMDPDLDVRDIMASPIRAGRTASKTAGNASLSIMQVTVHKQSAHIK